MPEPTPPVDPTLAADPTPPAAPPAEPSAEPNPPADPPSDPPADPPTDPADPPAEPPAPEDPPVERVVPKPDEYVLPEGTPEMVAQWAHDNDLTQEQLDATVKQYGALLAGKDEAVQADMRQQGEALVKTWGKNADYNLSLVRRALAQNDDSEGSLKKLLDESGYGNHPTVLNFFLKLGGSLKEGGFLKNHVNRPVGQRSAAQSMFGNTHPSADN